MLNFGSIGSLGAGAPMVDFGFLMQMLEWCPPSLHDGHGFVIKLPFPYTHLSVSWNLWVGALHFRQLLGLTFTISGVTNFLGSPLLFRP